jgi:ATP-dependent protease ClpP protease subunit
MKTTTRTITRERAKTFTARPDRTLEWLGGVNYQNFEVILGHVKRMMVESPNDEIHLLINSYGGATGVGMSFYDAATSWLKPNLTTIGSGDVDSSGIIVFLSGKRRFLTKNTTLLFHMAGRTFGGDKRYTVADMEAMLNEDHLKDFQYACVVSDATHGRYTPAMIIDMMRRNTILTAAEAVEMGLAHAII